MRQVALIATLAGFATASAAQAPPPLPDGLDGGPPALPAGLDGAPPALPPGLDAAPPVLPAGLNGRPALPAGLDGAAAPAPLPDTQSPFRFTGFTELRHAARLRDDPRQGDATLSEARLHLEVEGGETVVFAFSGDLVADAISDESTDLATGDGAFDLRTANLFFRLGDKIDIRAGRQIMTWGTGDLLFINDLFPKDYASFFAGRSDDYLKAPSDAVRVSLYSDLVNADLVVMDAGRTDRIVTGERLSYTDQSTGEATDAAPRLDRPDGAEYALRLHRTFGPVEAALYGFHGHWKSPAGQTASGRATFPRLAVWGASLRAPVLGGIGYAEVGAYDSLEDRDGTDPMVDNSEVRWLVGYEREIARETTLGVQYMTTEMRDHDAYLDGLPAGAVERDRVRDLATLRLTKLLRNQTITASAFLFHSPGQGDGFLRATLDYDVTDNWAVNGTLSHFYGPDDTPFGQFEEGSSLGLSVSYNF